MSLAVVALGGDYLAIVTLGFGEIIRILLNNLTELTGGPRGIGSIPKPTFFNLEFSRRASEGSQTFHEFFGIAFNSNHRVMFLYLLALVLVLIALSRAMQLIIERVSVKLIVVSPGPMLLRK